MASNTSLRDRIIAGTGAVLFLLSALGFAVFAIIDSRNQSARQDEITQAELDKIKEKDTCLAGENEEVLAAPEPYQPEGGSVSELQVTDIAEGSGDAAKTGDCLVMKYYGTLGAGGTMFDENFTKPSALAFRLGQGSVIQGWDEGLTGMKPGGMRRLVIPADKAYGDEGREPAIPGKATLVFEVKLLRIQK